MKGNTKKIRVESVGLWGQELEWEEKEQGFLIVFISLLDLFEF